MFSLILSVASLGGVLSVVFPFRELDFAKEARDCFWLSLGSATFTSSSSSVSSWSMTTLEIL